MSAIEEVIAFARDYVNHPSARTKSRKAKITEAIYQLTGQILGKGCSTCYIEAIFKIINKTKMANYELRKGYVAQFAGQAYRGVKSFTNFNLQTDPAKYEPIAQEFLRLYPERARYFIRVPKLIPQVSVKPQPAPIFTITDPLSKFTDTIKSVTEVPKVTKSTRKKTTKKSN